VDSVLTKTKKRTLNPRFLIGHTVFDTVLFVVSVAVPVPPITPSTELAII